MSDSDDEISLDYQSAKQKFLKHINRLHNDALATDLNEYYGECVSCGQLGDNGSECSCGGNIDVFSPPTFSTPPPTFSDSFNFSTPPSTFSAKQKKLLDDEFRLWTENKMILDAPPSDFFGESEKYGFTLAQYVETEPSRMSWQQLAQVVPPIVESDDESTYSVEDIEMSNEEPVVDDELDEIQSLQEDLEQSTRNYEGLVAEREFLIEQLQACEDRIEEVSQEKQEIESEINRLNQEYNETVVSEQLINDLDEFSQAVQILLNASEFYDIKDLISAYARDGASLDEIKRQVILDAKITKKQQLLGNVIITPKSRNPDGLPKLHDSYLVDSYDI